MTWPQWLFELEHDPPPRHPVDGRAALRRLLAVVVVGALVVAVGVLAWHAGRWAAPTLVRWQTDRVDAGSDAPPLPPLPDSPFAR
ncbi:hypothetical protein GA0074696_2131 [Micromonospora purpureochromogenes]|uniref:Uncharacterized protein n=1 Tax=Micromonospora purpureochromogenes TaxID=47872 RepID=A0A1C4WUL6_9ACTN|nr:hypothetical protein [Micromonospora purpureochromogenes]SCE99888.1 hypothetical protein GA0074696_2131 [Micromonospora purpureochromogenes]